MRKAIVFIVLFLAAILPVQANLVINGSFEDDPNTDVGSFLTCYAGYDGITGWTIGGAGVDWIGSYWTAAAGSRSLDMSAYAPGSVSQTNISTVIGQSYKLSFAMSGNPDSTRGQKVLDVTVGNLGAKSFYYNTATKGNTHGNMQWEYFSYQFTADSTNTLLQFTSGTDSAFGPALDDVSVEAVPEPISMLLGSLGLGCVAGFRKLRK